MNLNNEFFIKYLKSATLFNGLDLDLYNNYKT